MERFRSLEANLGPAPRCCWNRSPCAIKSPCWSAVELVARAFAVGIGCFESFSLAGGPMARQPDHCPARDVLRWRREGWSAFWRYRARGRWRCGRPRVSGEVRHLIAQMACENFLWGAPRIHGELPMLGFSVSQATVSRYISARSRRPGQSWRTFLRNQAMAFGHHEYSEEWLRGDAGLRGQSYWAQFKRTAAAQTAAVCVGLRRGLGRQQPTLTIRRIRLRAAQCDRGVTHRSASASGPRRAAYNRSVAAFPIRIPPYEARASPRPQSYATLTVTIHADQVLRRHR